MAAEVKQTRTERLAAFDAVVAEYEARLLRYAARVVNDHNAAQDVVQDTFIRLFRKWDEPLTPSPKLSSWLYRVAHNRAVDHIRRTSRRQDLHTRHAEEQDCYSAPDRGEGFRVSDGAARAVGALKTLSLREQQLVILKVYKEKSYQEISDITGLKTGNVGYILHHAMRKMAAQLRRVGDHD